MDTTKPKQIIRGLMLAIAASLMLLSTLANADTTIRVLNWQGYGTDEAWSLEIFEESTGIKVEHENFSSEQEMLTKLRTNPGAYDVVLINSAFTLQAKEEGLIQAIDLEKVSNAADLSPGMLDNANFLVDGETFGVAWVWGLTSFAVNDDKFETPPDTIEALWDPANAGRVGFRDDAVEAVQLAAIALGQDMNNPSDLDAIREKLRALKPQIRTFWSSENEWNLRRVPRINLNFRSVLSFPKKGLLAGWTDCLLPRMHPMLMRRISLSIG